MTNAIALCIALGIFILAVALSFIVADHVALKQLPDTRYSKKDYK